MRTVKTLKVIIFSCYNLTSFLESYLIMQYFEGETLDVYVQNNGWLSEEQARYCFKALITTICEIHKLKIAHRDIKPQNLMINDNLDIMLIDFNISKKGKVILKDDSEEEGKWKHKFRYRFLTQVSTPLYAAPELVNHWLYTESIDIWGAGVILYLMLFGDIPFRTKGKEVKEYTLDHHQKFISLIKEDWNISDQGKDLILNMLAFDSDDRPDAFECLEHPWCKGKGDDNDSPETWNSTSS